MDFGTPPGPIYSALPNAKMAAKIIGRNINPTENPAPLPNEFDSLMQNIIPTMMFTIGMKDNINSHPLPQNSSNILYWFAIGTIDHQPGIPAFTNNFHVTNMEKTIISRQIIIRNGFCIIVSIAD